MSDKGIKTREEIIALGKQLFITKGYEKTSVEEMIRTLGISKGGFYHHFKSKEEVMDAVIMQITMKIVDNIKDIVALENLDCLTKMGYVLHAMNIQEEGTDSILDVMHKPQNALMHQKSLVMMVNEISPFFSMVLEQGNKEGVLHCAYTDENAQMMLILGQLLFDDGVFSMCEEKKEKYMIAFMDSIEKIVGAENGTIRKLFTSHINKLK